MATQATLVTQRVWRTIPLKGCAVPVFDRNVAILRIAEVRRRCLAEVATKETAIWET